MESILKGHSVYIGNEEIVDDIINDNLNLNLHKSNEKLMLRFNGILVRKTISQKFLELFKRK